MAEQFALVSVPEAPMFETPAETTVSKGRTVTNISDECLYGMPLRVLEDNGEFAFVITYYGYAGYIRKKDIIFRSHEEVAAWMNEVCRETNGLSVDVLSNPSVQGCRILTLSSGSLVSLISKNEGWSEICLVDGTHGYLPTKYLSMPKVGMGLLQADSNAVLTILSQAAKRDRSTNGGCSFNFQEFLGAKWDSSEEAFRSALIDEAKKYLGVEYRWGSRSSFGLDCSGLVSMVYQKCGVFIYRDAALADGFPVQKLERCFDPETRLMTEAAKPGDLLYFPGHIAMYIGDQKYIHATALAGSNGVVINSLVQNDPAYRDDLPNKLYAVGGLR